MELKGTHTFAAPPQTVWNALHDSTILKNSIPGAESVAWQGDNAVTLSGGMGPIKGTLTAQVESQPPSRMTFTVNRSSLQGALTVDLAPSGSGTLVTYSATANASGPIGAAMTMAQGMIKKGVDDFFAKMDSQLQ